jgi:hypothetical protein
VRSKSVAAFSLSVLFLAAACATPSGASLEGAWTDDTGFYHYSFKADGSVSAYADWGDLIHGGIMFPQTTWRGVGQDEFEITSDWGDEPQVQRMTLQGDRLVLPDGSTWIRRAN